MTDLQSILDTQFVRADFVYRRYSITSTTLKRWQAERDFPPVYEFTGPRLWKLADILEWEERQKRNANRAFKASRTFKAKEPAAA